MLEESGWRAAWQPQPLCGLEAACSSLQTGRMLSVFGPRRCLGENLWFKPRPRSMGCFQHGTELTRLIFQRSAAAVFVELPPSPTCLFSVCTSFIAGLKSFPDFNRNQQKASASRGPAAVWTKIYCHQRRRRARLSSPV